MPWPQMTSFSGITGACNIIHSNKKAGAFNPVKGDDSGNSANRVGGPIIPDRNFHPCFSNIAITVPTEQAV
jgi:hypothetical protein